MIHKITQEQLREITALPVQGITSSDRDEMAIPSYLHGNPLIRWLMVKRYECIAQLAGFSANDNVLEFGCGIGVFLPTLCADCGTVYAIDLFPQYAKALVEKLDLRVTFPDSLTEVTDHSLDYVIAADVLEHFTDPDSIIALMRQKLKQTGKLVISGPTENPVYKAGRIIAGFADKGDYHHTNINELISRIANAGFRLRATRTLPFRFPPFLFKIALLCVD